MPKHLLLTLGLLVSSAALAQTSPAPIPAEYTLKAASDYDRYAPQVIATINWLEASTLPSDNKERLAANTFLIQWLSGSPTVSVVIEQYVTDLYNKDGDLLIAFMGGWTRYAIQNPSTRDKLVLASEGIKNMLATYKTKGSKGNKKLDDLENLSTKGQLSNWVKKHVKA